MEKSWGKRLFREEPAGHQDTAPAHRGPLLPLGLESLHCRFHLQAEPAAFLHFFLELLVGTVIGDDLEEGDPKSLRRAVWGKTWEKGKSITSRKNKREPH